MSRAPGAQGIPTFDPVTLVDHGESVPAHWTVEQVYDRFRHHSHEFAAVIEGERLVGLISRGHLGFLLGTRYGFTLHSRHLIQDHLLPASLVTTPAVPLLSLLEQALARTGEAFYHDVPLTDPMGRFLGIIPVPSLVRAQFALIAEQVHLAESRRNELQNKNHELFRSLHQLRQSQGRYHTLFQHSPLPVALLDPDGRVEAHNAKLEQLLGHGRDLESFHPNLADLMLASHRGAFLELLGLHESGAPLPRDQQDEFRLQLPGSGERLFKFHTSLVRETGQICTILHDVTGQRELERQWALNDKALLFESLVGGIAHELNNKLAPVLGFSELLSSRLETMGNQDKLQSYCSAISRSAEESVRIIRQLLQLSRPATMELRSVDLGALISEAGSIMRFRLRAAGADLRLHLPPNPLHTLADPSLIKQVLINLMINGVDAIEHAAHKSLDVQLECHDGKAVILVRDTGHGIPPDKLTRIFDPFYTTKSAERGTGLGLSVCLGIIRQHKGEISVTSVPGEGTAFQIQLPLAQATSPALATPEVEVGTVPVVAAGPMLSAQLPAPRRLDVLVIDDEEYITSLVQELLRSTFGWKVERAHNGRLGIQRLEQAAFDLIITDLRMPGLDGFALLGWIRDYRPALLPRVLVITGDSGSQSLEEELLHFAVPALRKPFTPEELLQRCQSLLPVG